MKHSLRQVFVVLCVVMLLPACTSVPHKQVGVNQSEFFSCPSSPNCVSSMSKQSDHYIEPICYANVSTKEAKSTLLEWLNHAEQYEIVMLNDQYIHAEFTSQFFHFIDDVEFYFPANEKLIHVKSASRLGYYDFGQNRARINSLTTSFKTGTPAAACVK